MRITKVEGLIQSSGSDTAQCAQMYYDAYHKDVVITTSTLAISDATR